MTDDKRKTLYALIKALSGQENILTIPRLFIDLVRSHRAALLLSQAVYWSDRSTHDDGWFYKSFRAWKQELGLNQHAVETSVAILKKMGVLHTELKLHGTRLTTWYKPDIERLAELLEAYFTLAETDKVKAEVTLAETAKVPYRKPIRSSIKHRLRSKTTTIAAPDGAASDVPASDVPAPDKPKRAPTARQVSLRALEEAFATLTGLELPKRDTEAQRKAGAQRWWNPLGEIYDLCQGDVALAEDYIRGAYQQMIDHQPQPLTVSAPQSVLANVKALAARAKQGNGNGLTDLADPVLRAVAKSQQALAQGGPHGRS